LLGGSPLARKLRIGVFGGSFDPVHHAHLIVARLAAEQLQLDRVHFVVAATQPFKDGRHAATAEQRFRMVELAVAGVADFVADGRELRRPSPSYTIDTLRELVAEAPGAELALLIGADVARRFGEWREPAEIRKLARIAVFRRGDLGVPDAGATGFDAEVAVPSIEISSTAIRARAAAGQSLAGWVPPAVADYIVASQVYVEL